MLDEPEMISRIQRKVLDVLSIFVIPEIMKHIIHL